MTTQKNNIALFAISLIAFVAFFDYTIVNTALPTIQGVFHVSVLHLQWIMNIYSLSVSATMIIFGRLGDMHGRRLVFYLGVLMLLVGSLGAGLSQSLDWLIAFRGLQAIGVSAVVTLAASLIIVIFADKAPKALGVYGVVTAIGLAIGPTLGGFLVLHVGWRWVFLINVPLLIIAFFICLPLLSESKADEEKVHLDYLGAVLLIAAISLFIYGLIKGEQLGWAAPTTWVCLIAAVILTIVLIIHEERVATPIFNLRLFKNSYFTMAGLCTSGVGLVVTTIMFFQPLFLAHVFNYNAKQIGFILIATPVAIVLFAALLGKISAKFHIKYILYISYVLLSLAVVIQYFVNANTAVIWIVVALFIVGLAWTICNTLAALAAQKAVKPSQASLAVGFVFTLFNVAAAIGLAVGSVIFNATKQAKISLGDQEAFAYGQQEVYLFLIVTMLVILAIGMGQLSKQGD